MHDEKGNWIHDTKSVAQHLLDAGLVTHACECGARCSYDPNRPKDAPKMKCGHCGKAFAAK